MNTPDRLGLDKALASWPSWNLPLSGPPSLIAPVPGGRTNANFRLAAPGMTDDLVLRIHHPESKRLGIDRGMEFEILKVTAAAGIGRPCWHWDSQNRFALFPYIEARQWTAADFANPNQLSRLWPLLEQLHLINFDHPRRRYADYLRHYWQQLNEAGAVNAALKSRWQAFEQEVEAFDCAHWPARLVHHDLNPANVLDTGDNLILIDWEYAAPGHPDIDRWSIDPTTVREPFVAELMCWINDLWERLLRL